MIGVMVRGAWRLAGAIALACAIGTSDAHADETNVEAARRAYDRGAQAYDVGDYPRAAAELSRADELAASDVALELAIKAALKADDPRTAITLAARAEKRSRSATLAAAAQGARTKMAGRTGTVTIMCAERSACTAMIDAKDVPVGEPQVVVVGGHRVLIESAGARREEYDVRIDPDAVIVVNGLPLASAALGPAQPRSTGRESPAKKAAADSSNGISPVWFWLGVGLTTVVSGAALVSAIDTRGKHEDFQSDPSPALQQSGLDAQLRTNLLAGGAGFSGLATLVVGLLFVDWRSSRAAQPARATPAPSFSPQAAF